MNKAKLNIDKAKRLINVKRSDLNKKQKKDRDNLREDISKRGMLGQGPGNQQLLEFFEIQLKELGEVLLHCYANSIQPNKYIDENLIKIVSQHIAAAINNQSEAFKNMLIGDMNRRALPKSLTESFIQGMEVKTNMVNKYILDKLHIEITDINENLGYEPLKTNNYNNEELDIFISHSGKDKGITKQIIDLLRSALNIGTDRIRCTSIEGYKLPGGANTEEHLRDEVFGSKILIGIITPSSLKSAYVLFELGARWGSKKRMIPLLANGIITDDLKGPLEAINCLNCNSSGDMHQLIDNLAEFLDLKKQSTPAYQSTIETISKKSAEYIGTLKDDSEFEEKIVFENGLYWKGKGESREGPFCQVCKENNEKLIHLVFDEVDVGEVAPIQTWHCKVCRNNY